VAADIIQITGLEITAIVGILEAERVKAQQILLDLEIYTDIRPAASSRKNPKHYQKQNLSVLGFIARTDLEAL
jgi:dihydroneopterin aldolase